MHGFNPDRLREIRVIRRIRLDQLAADLGVTKQAVSKYEHGKSIPHPNTIDKMLTILNIPRNYLLKESIDLSNNSSPLFFRALSSTTKGNIEYARIISLWGYEIIQVISNNQKRDFSYGLNKNLSIPQKAIELRNQWGVGTAPINNLTNLLEQHGFFIFAVDSSELKTDAYSRIINGVPIIVLNKHKGTSVRWRFNLAHELGHLIMHNNLSDWEFQAQSKTVEQEANLFAQHFLMPCDSFEKSIISSSLEHFVPLKKIWGVSIGAMIYHCGQLGIIDEHKVKSLQIKLGSLGWKKIEPLDDQIEFEEPHRVGNMLASQIIDEASFRDMYDRICLPLDEIKRICSLPAEYLTEYEINRAEEDFTQLSLF